MIKLEIKLDKVDYNSVLSKVLPDKLKKPVVNSVIKVIPAKEQLAVKVISMNKDKIIDSLNNYTNKEDIPIEIHEFSIDRVKKL